MIVKEPNEGSTLLAIPKLLLKTVLIKYNEKVSSVESAVQVKVKLAINQTQDF